ncbi:sensor histidine kinase [Flavimarina sp. Hel_I_48]|uniref:sensor histidine kinase n=1 Tax=Flavimarina sp. Hel_I_48 TaxID=1392488 RepID=UPI001F132596|nr:HAMP domain-containing sensor histidine kinase [Flavimarina sp. Hel_I_48]
MLRKASTTFLFSSAVIMIVSAVALYIYTSFLLKDEIEEELFSDKDRIERLLTDDPELKGIPPIMTVEKVNNPQEEQLVDTLIYDPLQDEIELFRQLSGTKMIHGQHYRVAVRAMVIESENILFAIVFTFLAIIFLAFVFLFYLNRSRNEKLWKPFFINLEKLKGFSLQSGTGLNFIESNILEFDELNREMKSLTQKVSADYGNLKQFTEDVSHEIQTPLAIMQAKIDTLINDQDISERQYGELSSLQDDIQRLKQLNKRLSLLVKIDNDQFTAEKMIGLDRILMEGIENLRELTAVQIDQNIEANVLVKIDPYLASVLFNNLLSNAIRHNMAGRPVEVHLTGESLRIMNHGDGPLHHPERIFERFYRESNQVDSTGLGLSIVKKICDYYGFVPSYSFVDGNHIFYVSFLG